MMSSSLLRTTKRMCMSQNLQLLRLGHDSHGPNMPPFARLRPPVAKLNEETELVWDDSVAPETCVDFDAQHVSSEKVFKHFLFAFGCIFTLYGLVKYSNPSLSNPVAPRASVINYYAFRSQMGITSEDSETEEEEEEED